MPYHLEFTRSSTTRLIIALVLLAIFPATLHFTISSISHLASQPEIRSSERSREPASEPMPMPEPAPQPEGEGDRTSIITAVLGLLTALVQLATALKLGSGVVRRT